MANARALLASYNSIDQLGTGSIRCFPPVVKDFAAPNVRFERVVCINFKGTTIGGSMSFPFGLKCFYWTLCATVQSICRGGPRICLSEAPTNAIRRTAPDALRATRQSPSRLSRAAFCARLNGAGTPWS